MNVFLQNISNGKDDGNINTVSMKNAVRTDTGVGIVKETISAAYEKSGIEKAMSYCEHTDNHAKAANQVEDELQTSMDMNIVLSNTMSGADYSKACEDGFDMKDMDGKEASNILDKIKVVLAKSGTAVEGFNDELDRQELAQITGSEAYASEIEKSLHENDVPVTQENVESIMEAVNSAGEISVPDWSEKQYIIGNNYEPTIKDIYQAEYSTNGTSLDSSGYFRQDQDDYFALKADDANIEQLMPQIEKVIENAGLDPEDDDNTDRCVNMIKNGIPLTAENLVKCTELDKISFPLDREEVVKAGASAIADGKAAIEGNLANPMNMVDRAVEIADKVSSITDEDMINLKEKDIVVNIRNLVAESQSQNHNQNQSQSQNNNASLSEAEYSDTADKYSSALVKLEQVRLKMSAETNLKLLRSDFQIDTAPIEELIEKLSEQDDASGVSEAVTETSGEGGISKSFGITKTDSQTNLFSMSKVYQIMDKVGIIPELDEGYIGALKDEFSTDTLDTIIDKALDYTVQYKKASDSYSDTMTKPRFDLGDSLAKAFGNVDSLLSEIGETATEQNRKAVRILGYNSIEVNKDNLEQVRAIDTQLTKVTDKLKPAAVLEMIRKGENPLSMTLDELEENLDEIDSSNQFAADEKYSKFLYKLEQNADITSEERSGYIGIYRLFDKLQKTDDAAIGAVLNTGADMTIGNLLAAMRSTEKIKTGMDYTIDDSFGGAAAVSGDALSISSQIEDAFKYYSDQADIVYENMEPEKLHKAAPDNDTGLSELAYSLSNAEADKSAEDAWQQLQLKNIREGVKEASESGAAKLLSDNAVDITASGLTTASQMIAASESSCGGIWDQILKTLGKKSFSENKKDILSSYKQNIQDISDELTELVDEDVTGYIDMTAIAMMHRQLSMSQQMADHNTYDVPVQIGDTTVSMHITLRESEDEGSYMDASIRSPEYGELNIHMSVDQNNVTGILSCEDDTKDGAKEYCDMIRLKTAENIRNEDSELNVGEIEYNTIGVKRVEAGTAKVADKTLFTLAHAFISAVGNGDMNEG